jgi:hypothetical protein
MRPLEDLYLIEAALSGVEVNWWFLINSE